MSSTKRRQASFFKGKGPKGRNLCFCGCGREVVKPAVNWFSMACVRAHQAINDPATIRRNVLARDRGICGHCGVDTEERARTVREYRAVFSWLAYRHFDELFKRGELLMFPGFTESGKRYYEYRVRMGEKVHMQDGRFWAEHELSLWIAERFGKAIEAADGHTWEADHIVPVIEGGGLCGLENYRTLCLGCHRIETAALAKRRAEARQKAKLAAVGQTELLTLKIACPVASVGRSGE